MTTEPTTYTTVFDLTEVGYRQWTWTVFGLLFVVVLGFVARYEIRRRPEISKLRRAFVLLLPALPIVWTLLVTIATYSEYAKLSRAIQTGHVAYVEGPVENFSPMPATGHAMEHFEVAGRRFEYSDNVVTAGFNHTAVLGGPIRAGRVVRVGYVGGAIVHLQVAQ